MDLDKALKILKETYVEVSERTMDMDNISKKSMAQKEREFKESPLYHAQSIERPKFGHNNGKDDGKDIANYRIGMHDNEKHKTHYYEPEYRYGDNSPEERAESTKERIKQSKNPELFQGRVPKDNQEQAKAKAERRHNDKINKRMNNSEALSLLEEILSEASVGALARAAENNLPKRRKAAADAIKGYRKSRNDYNTYAEKHPEDEEALYKKMEADDEVAAKALQKAADAEDIKDLKLPKDSKVSANKVFQAGHKVEKDREDKVGNSKDFGKDFKRMVKVHSITTADPVKSRMDEALEILEATINELHITDKALKAKMNKSWNAGAKAEKSFVNKSDKFAQKQNDDRDKARKDGTLESKFAYKPSDRNDVGYEIRLYPKETADLRKDATESNRQFDRYHRARERYNARHPEAPIERKNKDVEDGTYNSMSNDKWYKKTSDGYKTNLYKKESDHWGNSPEPEAPEKIKDKDKINKSVAKHYSKQATKSIPGFDRKVRRAHKSGDDAKVGSLYNKREEAYKKASGDYEGSKKRSEQVDNYINKKYNSSEALSIMEEIINELKPETYGSAVGARLNKANADINKERQAKKEFDKDKTNVEKANALDDIGAHNVHDYDSNVQKAARDMARVQDFMRDRKWSPKEKEAYKEAAKDAHTVKADGGPYSVTLVENPKRTTKARRESWKEHYPRFKDYKFDKNENLSIVEEMLSLANSIFEEDPQAPETEGVPPSGNKIKQTRKGKGTDKPSEVVSVADELFPYEGTAKEQMNQKILAKINDMIEGTATLEDLLQLVRKNTKKSMAVRESFGAAEEILEEIINEVSVAKWKQAANNSIEGRTGVRKKRAEDLSKTLPNSKRPANKVVNAADKVIVNRGEDEAINSDIYGIWGDYDTRAKMKKAELYDSANKKKYHQFRDSKRDDQHIAGCKDPINWSTYNSPHYDERPGKHNRNI